MRRTLLIAIAAVWLTPVADVRAEVRLPTFFSESMVLQHGTDVPIWGWADAGQKVTVTFAGQTVSATADGKGKWLVRLKPLAVSDRPQQLTVTGGNRITVTDVLVGDVWICSGQSNMEMRMHPNIVGGAEAIAMANHPNLRLCRIPKTWTVEGPKSDAPGAKWQACTPKSIRGLSAVGYFFSKELHEKLKIPVGLIDNSKGGSPTESWTNPADMAGNPAYDDVRAFWKKHLAVWPEAKKKFDKDMAAYKKALAAFKTKQGPRPRYPYTPFGPEDHRRPTALWNGMVAPLVPVAIKGVIWYQGEANSGYGYEYRTTFPNMIRSWRKAWGQGDFPFLFVQLPNFMKRTGDPNERGSWAELREAQAMTLSLPATAMAVTIDVGEEKDIHPRDKAPVGHRLALAALANVYGKKIVWSGPVLELMTVDGDKARLHFTHVGGGLVAKGGPLKGFAVAGKDKVFHWATSTIDGATVVLQCDKVAEPVAVRYAFNNNPECNLYNKEGLPARPFRTDQWTHHTKHKRVR